MIVVILRFYSSTVGVDRDDVQDKKNKDIPLNLARDNALHGTQRSNRWSTLSLIGMDGVY